ncbi:hypothetical protein ACI2LC_46465 [Nonomuraea wenchangensis]|uniref:hypothetical protein n=1 Tax=Nonomuraea TaxID=83681 RepID=UPI0037933BBC
MPEQHVMYMWPQDLKVLVRIVAIVRACQDSGISPAPLTTIHAVAYFADVLAPVWQIPVLESQILKKAELPTNPELQRDIDRLVGIGVLVPSNIRHIQSGALWRLDANYALHSLFGPRILDALERDNQYSRELHFVREVTLALAGIGTYGLGGAVLADATYSDPLLGIGSVVDLAPENSRITRTVEVSERFRTLMASQRKLSDAEVIHLYVRHLYSALKAGG